MATVDRPTEMLSLPHRIWSRLAARRRRTDDPAAPAQPVAGRGAEDGAAPDAADHGTVQNTDPSPDLEVVGVMRALAEQLTADRERTLRLIEGMDTLPASLEPLPEIGRTNSRLLESLRDQAVQTRTYLESLGASLAEAVEDGHARSDKQSKLIADVRKTLQHTTQTSTDTREALTTLQDAAGQLSTTTERLANALQRASERAGSREKKMMDSLEQTRRSTVMAVYVCGGISTAALIAIGLLIAL